MKIDRRKVIKHKEKNYNSKGITLIALVITIIVLLILAAVSIATLTGENGILTKAQTAKEETQKATAKEKVQVAVMGSYDEDKNLDLKQLNDNINKIEGIDRKNLPINGLPVIIMVDSYEIKIFENGKVEFINESDENGEEILPEPPIEENFGISAKDISNCENKSEYYGKIVTGYECENNEGIANWKIFYADNSNIYLIASDYIKGTYCPPSENNTITYSTYKVNMSKVILDYTGTVNIVDSKIQALNSSYFNYLTENTTTSINNNIKATAYMLDTKVWKPFVGDKAEYAIGGPTIELLFKSYNGIYEENYQAQARDEIGYQISQDGGINWSNNVKLQKNALYVLGTSKTNAMWIASPSTYGSELLFHVAYDGTVSDNRAYNYTRYRFSTSSMSII